ncbi:complex I subunit 5 family protein [Methylocella sp.]|uniref:complex I subunit 5 family protein n=1 Tax=Methylocella sp. TaxID=1978226 RepID=UPI00378348CD
MNEALASLSGAAASPGGLLLPAAVLAPVVGVMAAFTLGGRNAQRVALALAPVNIVIAALIASAVWRARAPIFYHVGGFAPPLGLSLRADGFSAVMLATSALVMAAAHLFARADFATPAGVAEARAPFAFWTLTQALSAALAIVFLSADLFNLFVALELLTFAAVPLVCLKGSAETLRAALRYLLFALIGSVLYLLGVTLLYGAYGTLDMALLAERLRPAPIVYAAAALATAGLLAKTALVPLHLWLPPAHANAPAPASAILSALVVKGSFFLIVRLWFDVFPALAAGAASALIAGLGCLAILVGGTMALRQARLKPLIAYSTVAQLGYLFLMFPLAVGGAPWAPDAWAGGVMQTLSHAFAKAGMFLAAGLVVEGLGHDRIADLRGLGRAMPLAALTLGIGGLSLVGLPPSGGFMAKWLLLTSAAEAGFWPIVAMLLAGGLMAGAYVGRILGPALATPAPPLRSRPHPLRGAAALALAVVALLMGLAPLGFYDFLDIGRPLIP